MYNPKFVFSQLVDFLNRNKFNRIIKKGNDIAVGPLKPANLTWFAGFLAFFS